MVGIVGPAEVGSLCGIKVSEERSEVSDVAVEPICFFQWEGGLPLIRFMKTTVLPQCLLGVVRNVIKQHCYLNSLVERYGAVFSRASGVPLAVDPATSFQREQPFLLYF